MTAGIRKEINGVSYLFWNRFYWLPTGEKIHDCDITRQPRKIIIYKKFRKYKGKLKEMRYYGGICQECKTDL